MATSSVTLDIRANTSKALSEFKKFSAQLDNKFLISGLKLDVVRSSLGQINREFQKAIGEQGLAAGASMRAAENQAALLTQTFKSFSQEASLDMTTRFSEAINSVAVNIGSTTEDIKKVINATPWISTNLSQNLRDELTKGMLEFGTQARRAGFATNYAETIQRFLMNQVTPEELINSGDSLKSRIGLELAKIVGVGGTPSSEARSRAVLQLQRNKDLANLLREGEARVNYGQFVIEELNSRLFNPQKGIFGVLRQVTMSVGDKTTLLTETKSLIESVFGKQGFFVIFFKEVGKIFGIEDPLKTVITGVRWITRQFHRLTDFLDSPQVKGVSSLAQKAIGGTVSFFTGLYDNVTNFFTSEDGERITKTAKKAFQSVFTLESTMGGIIGAILGSVIPGVGTLAGAGMGGSIGALSSLFKEGDREVEAIKNTYSKGINAFKKIFDDVLKIFEGDNATTKIKSVLSSIIMKTTGFFDAIFDTINSGDWDPSKINEQIDRLGNSIRTLIENVGKGFREADFSKEGKFFLSLFKNLVGEIFKTLGVAIRELITTLFSSKGIAAIGAVSSTIGTAVTEFFKGLLGNGLGSIVGGIASVGVGVIFARRFLGVLVGVLGPIAREITRIFRGGGGLGGFANRLFGGGPGGPLDTRRRPPTVITGRGGGGIRVPRFIQARAMAAQARAGIATQGVRSLATRGASAINALPWWAKALALGGTALTTFFATTKGAKSEEMPQESSELVKTQAEETKKKERESKQKKLDNLRTGLGIGAGLAGGLAGGKAGGMAGAALGTAILGPKGTLIGGAIGGILGSIIGGTLGEEAVKKISDPVLDGVGKLAGKVGDFFSKTLPSNFNSAMSGATNFLSNIGVTIQTSFENSLKSLQTFDLGALIQSVIKKQIENFKVIGGTIGQVGSTISTKAQELFSQAITNFSRTIDGLKTWFSNLPGVKGIRGLFDQDRSVNTGPLKISSANVPNLAESMTSEVKPVSYTGFGAEKSISANFKVEINVNGNMDSTTISTLEERLMAVLDKSWKDVTAGTVDRGTVVI